MYVCLMEKGFPFSFKFSFSPLPPGKTLVGLQEETSIFMHHYQPIFTEDSLFKQWQVLDAGATSDSFTSLGRRKLPSPA